MRVKIEGPYSPDPESTKPIPTSIYEGLLPAVQLVIPRKRVVLVQDGSTERVEEVEPYFLLEEMESDPTFPKDVSIRLSFREATLLADALQEQLKNYREMQVSWLARKPKQR